MKTVPVQSAKLTVVEYRVIPEFPGYRVGNDGSAWTCWNLGNHKICGKWKKLRAKPASHGYPTVGLHRDGKRHFRLVHRLVLQAFVGHCPKGMECRHLDGDQINNRLENLQWGTRTENMADMIRHGKSKKGSNLSADTIARISAAKRGKPGIPRSIECRAKISAALKGKPKSLEHIAAMTRTLQERRREQ